MVDFIKENRQFVLLFIFWLILGKYIGMAVIGVVSICLYALFVREKYTEIFIAFFAVLILSDNRFHYADWADTFKNVFLVLLLLFMWRAKKDLYNDFQFLKLFLPFYLLSLFLISKSETPLVSFEKSTSYFLLISTIPNFIIAGHKKNGNEFFRSLIWFVTLMLSYGFVLKVLFADYSRLEARYMGIFGNPNGAGIFCMLFFILVYVLNEKLKLFVKKELIVIFGIIFLTIVLSGSRTAIFSISIFLLFRYFNNISPAVGFLMLVLIIIGYEFIFLNFQTIVDGLGLGEYFRLDTIKDGSGRFIAWNFAYENVKEAWWFGRGFGYTEYLFKFYELELSMLGHQGNAHNSYLTIWLDTGFVGLVLFLRALLLLFFKGAKMNRTSLGVLYAVLFSVYFESWLIGSLNPITIQVYIILTVLTANYFNTSVNSIPEETQESQMVPAIS